MLAERLRTARGRAGLTQKELAIAVGKDRSLLSHVEGGRKGLAYEALAVLAQALNVSVDYLLGLTDDPDPTNDQLARAVADTGVVPIHSEPAVHGVSDGAVITLEGTAMPFRRFRLEQEGIDPEQAAVFRVKGDSMSPTLPDRSVILVDYLRAQLSENCLYVVQIDGSLWPKRAVRNEGEWWLNCDNPNWAPIRRDDRMHVWGQIRWVGHGFSD